MSNRPELSEQLLTTQFFDPHTDAGTYPELCSPDLPIYDSRSDIATAITEHQAVVIISPTGTGKSTQLPKIALAAGFDRIHETQPRRPAAVNVGSRILFELGVVLGEEKASELVAWQTGAGYEGSRDAAIQVVTQGILLRREAFRRSKGSNEIWMLDEIHEQGKDQAVLMERAKQKMASNPDFTAVFMTATPDKHGLISYLTDEHGQEPAVIELTAPMHNVEYRERPKSDIITETLRAVRDIHANPEAYGGSNTIQVFESGVHEINDLIDELYTRLPADVLSQATILANHAKLSQKMRERVYEDVEGIKVVVQTNIGKTSNTVPRTRYVITRGKERQIMLDEEGAPILVETDISQDCMSQQAGRAGRTSDGIFVHTKRAGQEYVPIASREPHMTPEIQRSELDELVLYYAFIGENIRTVDFKDQPDPQHMERAVARMKALEAIDGAGSITDIGKKMYTFAASPEGQRSMVESLNYPQHIRRYMAAMIAMSENGGMRQFFALESNQSTSDVSEEHSSDMLACLDAFIDVQGKSLTNIHESEVSVDNYLRVDELFRKLASSAGVTELGEMKQPTEAERAMLRACILAGYANDIYVPKGEGMFKRVGGAPNALLREICERSVVHRDTHTPVVGKARTVQTYQKGKVVPKPIIETVTRVTWGEIGSLAIEAARWDPVSLRLRGDKFVAIEEQSIEGKIIDVREIPAEPGPRLRAAVIEQVKDNPGKNLLYLYKIKSETERLAHKSRLPIKKLTQDAIDAIMEAVTPEDVTNPSHVEETLRQYIVENQVSLDSFVTQRERANIIRNAPAKLQLGDTTLKLQYRQGKPLVYVRTNIEPLGSLPDMLQLEDGRDVLFVYDDTRLTSLQLKNKLRAQGLL